MTVTGEATEKRSQKVDSGLVAFDELPPAPERARGGGGSEFDTLLGQLHADKQLWNKPVSMRRYENETAAKAAANVLRQRNGRVIGASGHEFHVREIDDKGVKLHHLFVIYDPKRIVDGEWDKHVAYEKERVAKIEAKKAEKERVSGNGAAARMADQAAE